MRTLLRSGVRRWAPVDLARLFREIADSIGEEARQSGVLVRILFGESLRPIDGDHGQLRQALLNLATNAIDAIRTVPEPRQLTLQAAKGG